MDPLQGISIQVCYEIMLHLKHRYAMASRYIRDLMSLDQSLFGDISLSSSNISLSSSTTDMIVFLNGVIIGLN